LRTLTPRRDAKPAREEGIVQNVFLGPQLVFSADGKVLAAADLSWRLYHVWEVATGKELGRLPMEAAEGRIAGADEIQAVLGTKGKKLARLAAGPVALSADGRLLAMGGEGGHAIRVWDLLKGAECCRLRGHGDEVRALAFSPDGALLSAGADQ